MRAHRIRVAARQAGEACGQFASAVFFEVEELFTYDIRNLRRYAHKP